MTGKAVASAISTKANTSHTHAISDVTNLQSTLDAKAASSDLTSHTGNTTVHITAAERTAWNAKADSSYIKDSTITLTQGGVTKGSFTLNQDSNATIELDPNTTVATLTTIAPGGTMVPDGHYQITMTANTTLNAGGGAVGKIGSCLLLINPGTYTFTAGTNLILVNLLTASKTNYCVLNWDGTDCRMYVVDAK